MGGMEPRQEGRHRLEEALGHRFGSEGLLETALTHPSWANEERQRGREVADNQRLEFLGDAILAFLVGELLVETFPGLAEGGLSRIRSRLVSEPHLAVLGGRMGLGDVLLLSAGEEASGARERPSAVADALEATIAAVYLDGGFDAVRAVVRRHFTGDVVGTDPAAEGARDPKSALQERTQSIGLGEPAYRVLERTGPSHRPLFVVEVRVDTERSASGTGSSRKRAEQDAARAMLAILDLKS